MPGSDAAFGGWRAGAILAAGLVIACAAALHEKKGAEERAEWEFVSAAKEIQARIADRMSAHQQVLRAGAGFMTRPGVGRNEWRAFVEHQNAGQTLPGIQGLGFALLVPRARLARHVEGIRAEGFRGYRVWPEGERSAYAPIVFLEPFSGRNLRAHGYDMLSEPVRRAAMERARDQDEPALSGKVTLVQETETDVQPGALMYMPVYRAGALHETAAERRAALVGWVYSPYRMHDLMRGVLGRWDAKDSRRIRLRVYDGEAESPEALLYDSLGRPAAPSPGTARRALVESAGRRWLLSFSGTARGNAAADYRGAWLMLIGGSLISALMSFLSYSLTRTRREARRIAARLTADLRESSERLKFAIEGTGDGVWDWHVPSGEVIFSRRWKEMLGYADDELRPRVEEWKDRVHPDDLPRTMAEVEAHFAGRTASYVSEHRLRCKDGGWKWILDRGVVVSRDGEGRPVRMIGTHADLTDRVRAEESQAKIQKLESLGNLAGGIAHDFNNILTAVLGNLSLLEHAQKDDGASLELIREAQNACRAATGLAGQLLTFVKGVSPVTIVTDLKPLLAQTAVFAARGSSARCVFELGERPLLVKIDSAQIAQVIQNLVLNAVQAMPQGGDIVVRAERVVLKEKEVPPLPAGRYVRVRIKDHGHGIPPEHMPRIFDPYFSTKAAGRGLGLTVCHSIMAKHGGDIRAESPPGEGAIFILHFPAAEAPESGGGAALPGAAPGTGKLLVMEDEAPVAKVLIKMTESLGYRADRVEDGRAALEAYEKARQAGEPYDAVIMDLTVPGGMGGREAIGKLRALDPKAKALVTSGYAMDPVMSGYAALGFSGVLAKPYRLEDVSEALRRVIGPPAAAPPEQRV